MATGPQLRNKSMSSTKQSKMSSEESKSLLKESRKATNKLDGFTVTPLIERSIWSRSDVWPFAFLYVALIALDQQEDLRILKMILFPVTLLSHLTVVLMQQWRVSAKCSIGYRKTSSTTITDWTHCMVQAPLVSGATDAGLVPVVQRSDNVAVVVYNDVVFRACGTNMMDKEMDGLWEKDTKIMQDDGLFHRLRFPENKQLDFYTRQWKGHANLDSVKQSHEVYGPNTTSIQLPQFMELLTQQLLAPFFLFQLFCVVLWSLDEYWFYALFTLFALLMFESTVAYNRLKSLERLRGTLKHAYHITAFRSNMWMLLRTDELVPGDIVSLTTARRDETNVPADLLLLHGNAVVDEALLTGESIPQLKGALESSAATAQEDLDMQDPQHKQSVLFGGTVLVSHSTDRDSKGGMTPPDGGIVCMVLKTGFETAQGSLLRTMAHSSKKSADGIHTQDTFVFVAILLVCAILSALSVLQEGWHDETRNRFRLTLHVIIIVTSVVPPELPMELSLAVTNSVADLMRKCSVFCTEPFRIPWAGQVDVCCFDKTGTLTSDEMRLTGVRLLTAGVDDDDKLVPPSEIPDLSWDVLRIMVGCHALSASGNGSSQQDGVIGDPLEKAILKDTGYTARGNNLVVATEPTPGRPRGLILHHRFAFSSKLKRMTVLLSEDNSKVVYAVTKGAPETIQNHLKKGGIPSNYEQVYKHHMGLGQRVLAMGYRSMGDVSVAKVKDNGRASLEKNLTFAGFLILDCPLKPDSKVIISELRKSDHETVMITGDAVLTAAEVARQVGIVSKECPTYELRMKDGASSESASEAWSGFEFVHLNTDSTEVLKSIPLSLAKLPALLRMKQQKEASFCVSGSAMGKVGVASLRMASVDPEEIADDKNMLLRAEPQEVLKELVRVISVYARHAPRQKEAVVAAYNLSGRHTLMCGDGTNDVGALKRAHVGISIISAPELEAKQRSATEVIAKEQKKDRKARKSGVAPKSKKRSQRLEASLRQLQEAQNDLDHVELGDASVASPFTSRAMSIKCCKDVLRQGRCTLVTMLTIYKILGVNCLVNALVLTKLHQHGVKQGDRQVTILGIVVAALFLFVTRGKPLPVLSPKRPPASVLCKQALVSIAAQFGVHLAFIMVATDVSLVFVDPYDPGIIPDASFNPNVLNTCSFLLTMVATVNTFVVNYRGKPFMQDLKDNKMLLRSAQVCYAVLFTCAMEVFPPLNDLMQLAPFPDTQIDLEGDDEWALAISQAGGAAEFVRSVGFPTAISLFMAADILLAIAVERITLGLLK